MEYGQYKLHSRSGTAGYQIKCKKNIIINLFKAIHVPGCELEFSTAIGHFRLARVPQEYLLHSRMDESPIDLTRCKDNRASSQRKKTIKQQRLSIQNTTNVIDLTESPDNKAKKTASPRNRKESRMRNPVALADCHLIKILENSKMASSDSIATVDLTQESAISSLSVPDRNKGVAIANGREIGSDQSQMPIESSAYAALKCPLCLERMTNPTATACGHVFCYDCIDHVSSKCSLKDRKCPICRKSIKKRRLHRIFI